MLRTVLVAAICALAVPAAAHEFTVGSITVDQPWARASAPTAPAGAAYMVLENTGIEADRLVAASSPVAEVVELHTHTMDGGIMRMRPVVAMEVAPGEPTVLRPGGLHVMLIGLTRPLIEGETFPLTLEFEVAGTIEVDVQVEAAGTLTPSGAEPGAMHHTN